MNFRVYPRTFTIIFLLFYMVISLSVCSCDSSWLQNISERGGIKTSNPKVITIILKDNKGYNVFLKKTDYIEKSDFYFLNNKIYASLGIARIGLIKKNLNKITEIPFSDDDYKRDGLILEKNCVYAVRYGFLQMPFISLLRIVDISTTSIRIQFLKVLPNE